MLYSCCFEINGICVCLYEESNNSDKETNDGDAMFAARQRNLAASHLLNWYYPSFSS